LLFVVHHVCGGVEGVLTTDAAQIGTGHFYRWFSVGYKFHFVGKHVFWCHCGLFSVRRATCDFGAEKSMGRARCIPRQLRDDIAGFGSLQVSKKRRDGSQKILYMELLYILSKLNYGKNKAVEIGA
jgi:hypothetical protein